MKRAVFAAGMLALSLHVVVDGQQAGQNINVLPVVAPGDPLDPGSVGEAALKGDLHLQRQVEPTIAVSTRNPNTVLAFFNDYRAVDIQNDPGLGESRDSITTSAWNFVKRVFAALAGRKSPGKGGIPAMATAAEAWVGGVRSYDGGITWSGMFVPGAPFDSSPASMAAPVKGLQAATDPVLAAAPCGRFYLAFLAFTRNGESRMVVARYEDHNNQAGGDTIAYQGMTVIETANNASWGYFLDKPAIAVDPARSPSGDSCAHNVYVTYTTFNGLEKDGKFRSKITFARSSNQGTSFATQKLNMPYGQNQNTVIAVDPREGTPGTTGGGTIYVAWRHFFGPDTILLHKSTTFGQTFSGQPVDLLAGSAVSLLQTFDQPTATTQNTPNPSADVSFRSNTVPTLAVTADGTLFAAWQERVDRAPGSATFQRPAPQAADVSPRIVVTRSSDAGASWTERQAVDMGDRDVVPPSAGLGLLPQPRWSGPQIMPKLAFGGGRLLLTYYESRGFMAADRIVPADVTPPAPGFISGIDRVMDLRAAVLNSATGALLGTSQVSRYPIRTEANLDDGEDLGDIAASNGACAPDDPGATTPCVRRVNHPNDPHSAAGTAPFIGDYVDAIPVVQFVPTADQRGWRWATRGSDVPYGGFHTIWADNRNLVRPTEPASLPLAQRYPFYTTPVGGVVCTNSGSRNTDVLTSNVNAELVVSAPIAFKQLENVQRAFPVFAHNGTAVTRFFRLSFATAAMSALASFDQSDQTVDTLDVQLFPYSGVTRVVYLPPSDTNLPVTVQVHETATAGGAPVPGGLTGAVTINADGSNPPLINANIGSVETYTPGIRTPGIRTPGIRTPGIRTPGIRTPGIRTTAISASAPDDTVYAVTDVTWTVTNEGNTTAAYSSLVNIDNPEQYDGSYEFQLIVSKGTSAGGLDGCSSVEIGQDQVLVVIPNPGIRTPSIRTPGIRTPGIRTATFSIPPDESGTGTSTSPAIASSLVASNDGTTKAPAPPNTVQITLRAYQMVQNPPVLFEPALDPPSLAVLAQSCNTDGTCPDAYVSPDLAFAVVPEVSTTTVRAGGTFTITSGTLTNGGAGPALAEDNDFRTGAFLVTGPGADGTFGTTDDLTAADTVSLGAFGVTTGVLEVGQTAPVAGGTLTVPAGTAPGVYTLLLIIDEGREVSEIDELNNVIAVPFRVTGPNTAPVAVDRSLATSEDTPLAITLSASDLDGDSLTFEVVGTPSHGTLSGVAPSLTYTPAPNYFGADSFTFKVSDGRLESNVATISITVGPVNDLPIAGADAVAVGENSGPVVIDVLANDLDVEGSALALVSVTTPSSGSAAISAGRIVYTPALNFVGVATFTYTVTDGLASATGTVTVTIDGGMADYGFLGLQAPWEPGASAKVGSAFPLVWQYTANGIVVNSSAALPEVRISGPYNCAQGETPGIGQFVADPGSSGLRYFTSTNTWQFNWQTTGLGTGCYAVRIFSRQTRQLNGPFVIRLRP